MDYPGRSQGISISYYRYTINSNIFKTPSPSTPIFSKKNHLNPNISETPHPSPPKFQKPPPSTPKFQKPPTPSTTTFQTPPPYHKISEPFFPQKTSGERIRGEEETRSTVAVVARGATGGRRGGESGRRARKSKEPHASAADEGVQIECFGEDV